MNPNPQTSRKAGHHPGAWVAGGVIFLSALYLTCPWPVVYSAVQAGRHGLMSERATHGVIRGLCKVPSFFALRCTSYKQLMLWEMVRAPDFAQEGSDRYLTDTLEMCFPIQRPPYPPPGPWDQTEPPTTAPTLLSPASTPPSAPPVPPR